MPDHALTGELSQIKTLAPGVETYGEDGSFWRRSSLEVRKFRSLTSRVVLRGVGSFADREGAYGTDLGGDGKYELCHMMYVTALPAGACLLKEINSSEDPQPPRGIPRVLSSYPQQQPEN
ncbi:hypothetical protein NDU88_005154 [Pleurodeles waltl]|uniref:Uncharacterized protein n=1 Tax=Pleurodeles waltl TaxID=8319 RepID=A0AAV7TUT8_PLEWA|nr:hypothetical protein NDU88_005154 [Pleurodeles waltl]